MFKLYNYTVADPGFPIGGCQPPMWVLFGRNIRENKRIWSHWGGGGAGAPCVCQCYIQTTNHSGWVNRTHHIHLQKELQWIQSFTFKSHQNILVYLGFCSSYGITLNQLSFCMKLFFNNLYTIIYKL